MSIEETIATIRAAPTWNQRVQQIRAVPQRHGTDDRSTVYSAVARELYMPHLAPDFAYVHEAAFYKKDYFLAAYREAHVATEGFALVEESYLARILRRHPQTLLVFRTLLGLSKEEFAHSSLLADPAGLETLSASQIDSMERSALTSEPRPRGTVALARAAQRATSAARTITRVMNGDLFGESPPGLHSKQDKPDTTDGWQSVRHYARDGVPLSVFLHQRHYGGAFRQVLDATSSKRGDLIEDAVEAMFVAHGLSFIRTGSHNQAEIVRRFDIRVTPAPDFVVFDPRDDELRAILECKGTNNGGTARDKALRFGRLKEESVRLGGVPLFAVLGGIGWVRINDALAPVVRDTDGRVFTLATLASMIEVAPFPGLLERGSG